MFKRILFLALLVCILAMHAAAQAVMQEVTGQVVAEGKGVEFAAVGLKGTPHGTTADANGNFLIKAVPAGQYELVVSALGFQEYRQTLGVGAGKARLQVTLKKTEQRLREVVVSGTLKETYSLQSPIHVETYTPKLFQKNPTPSIFEAMQMVNGVQPQLNCNVCNTGDIHINGMEGPYTMVTIDGMPIVSALGSVYGLSGIPNSMIQRVEVVKGPASTLYGSEAVGGLINIITKSPRESPLVAADLLVTSHGELNADLALKQEFAKAQSLLGINGFTFQNRRDVNHDNFTDITLQKRFSVFNKWNFNRPENRVASLAARYLYEDRWGGELNWQPEFWGGDSIYGESIRTKRLEVIGAYALPAKENITLQFSYNQHRQQSAYGNLLYQASQHIAFAQLLWSKTLNRHDLIAGLPFRYNFYDDNTPGTARLNGANKPQHLYLPGIFVQDEITLNENFTTLPGIRFDLNSAHGGIFSPRLGFKFSPDDHNTLRLNAGNGYRVVNLFTEDHAALTGSREVVIEADLKPERSWNASLNYQKFIDLKKGYLNLDGSLFYTYFTNKIQGDFLTDPTQIRYNNLAGHAISRGLTLNADWQFTFPLKLNAGATFMEVYTVEQEPAAIPVRKPQLHAPAVSATYALTYTLQKIGLSVDYTGRLYGPMWLPVLENDFRPDQSPWFNQDNVQVTKKLKHGLEVYGGLKNLYNFLPKHPLMRPFDPFDKRVLENNPEGYTFDTTYNYAPMQGRRLFLGMRWVLAGKRSGF